MLQLSDWNVPGTLSHEMFLSSCPGAQPKYSVCEQGGFLFVCFGNTGFLFTSPFYSLLPSSTSLVLINGHFVINA